MHRGKIVFGKVREIHILFKGSLHRFFPSAFNFHLKYATQIYLLLHTTVMSTFWSLGLIAFGGPQAHVAILRDHLVIRRNWINEEEFMELFAIGQVSAAVFIFIVVWLTGISHLLHMS